MTNVMTEDIPGPDTMSSESKKASGSSRGEKGATTPQWPSARRNSTGKLLHGCVGA